MCPYKTVPSTSLIRHINKKDWWRTAVNDEAIKERGLFLASSYKEAEFYGRPMDTPFKVNIKNPLIGDEKTILKTLNLKAIDKEAPIEKRFALDGKMMKEAIVRGYDSIALFCAKAYQKYLQTGANPRSIELNVFHEKSVTVKRS